MVKLITILLNLFFNLNIFFSHVQRQETKRTYRLQKSSPEGLSMLNMLPDCILNIKNEKK